MVEASLRVGAGTPSPQGALHEGLSLLEAQGVEQAQSPQPGGQDDWLDQNDVSEQFEMVDGGPECEYSTQERPTPMMPSSPRPCRLVAKSSAMGRHEGLLSGTLLGQRGRAGRAMTRYRGVRDVARRR